MKKKEPKQQEKVILKKLFRCPFCKKIDEVENKNNVLHCKRCKVFYSEQSLKDAGIKR